MWVAKLKLCHKDCPIVNRCVKFQITVLSYPRTPYSRKGRRYGSNVCKFVSYEEDKKKKYLQNLAKDQKITILDISGDVFVYEYDLGKKGEHVMLYFNPELVLVKPTVNSPDGHEYWEVGSWNKGNVTKFIEDVSRHMDTSEVLWIKNLANVELYFPSIMPKLSKAQEKAIMMAYQSGYYDYPRKVDLKQLAKGAGISIPSFQENLRKAENKLLPMLIERLSRQEK